MLCHFVVETTSGLQQFSIFKSVSFVYADFQYNSYSSVKWNSDFMYWFSINKIPTEQKFNFLNGIKNYSISSVSFPREQAISTTKSCLAPAPTTMEILFLWTWQAGRICSLLSSRQPHSCLLSPISQSLPFPLVALAWVTEWWPLHTWIPEYQIYRFSHSLLYQIFHWLEETSVFCHSLSTSISIHISVLPAPFWHGCHQCKVPGSIKSWLPCQGSKAWIKGEARQRGKGLHRGHSQQSGAGDTNQHHTVDHCSPCKRKATKQLWGQGDLGESGSATSVARYRQPLRHSKSRQCSLP